MIGNCGSGGQGGAESTSGDDGGSTFLNGRDEFLGEKLLTTQLGQDGTTGDVRTGDIRILSGGMVSPDAHAGHVGNGDTQVLCDLANGAIVVQSCEGGDIGVRNVGGKITEDECICICGIADDEHFDIAIGDLVNGGALGLEDARISLQQIGAFHALFARESADENGDIGALECERGVVGLEQRVEQGIDAVFQLHDDAGERREGGGNFEEVEVDRLGLAENGAIEQLREEGVGDLAGGTGEADGNWGLWKHGLGCG